MKNVLNWIGEVLADIARWLYIKVYRPEWGDDVVDDYPGPHDSPAYDMLGAPVRTDNASKDGVILREAGFGAHEAEPDRMNPKWDFYAGARFGDTPPWEGRFTNSWGGIVPAKGNDVWDVSLHIMYCSAWALVGGEWVNLFPQVPNPTVRGSFQLAGVFSSAGGNVAVDNMVDLAPQRDPGIGSFHWFYEEFYPRKAVPAGTSILYTEAELSLSGEPGGQFLASVGMDSWPTSTGGKPAGTQVSAFMQPRKKLVPYNDSRTFSAWVATEWFSNGNPSADLITADPILSNHPPTGYASIPTGYASM